MNVVKKRVHCICDRLLRTDLFSLYHHHLDCNIFFKKVEFRNGGINGSETQLYKKQVVITLRYIYIHSVFTEKPYSKQLECNVVYILIIHVTSSYATL